LGRIGQIGHDERLSLVGHLDELRTRLILSLLVVVAAFAVCMWQNNALLGVINAPLSHETQKQVLEGNGPLGSTYQVQEGARTVAQQLATIVNTLAKPDSGVSKETRASLAATEPKLEGAIETLSAPPQGNKPVTLGIGEPFTTTLTIALLFALILSLPFLLYQAYAFILPAMSPDVRGVTKPLMLAIPFLFVVGVTFGYFVVLPASVRFFQNFNGDQFNVLVQASQYYRFAAVILIAMGLVFQVPVGVLAVTRAGIVTTKQLAENRRYAVLACGGVAAFLPGDLITMLLEVVPLYLLFEASLLLARVLERRRNSATA
jgi:sec-independent protein translocase protein TatC